MSEKKKFYVTTPIYYATARPHLGTLYSTVLADISARWHKIQNIDTFFLTGTDEYGQKVAQAAEAENKDPKDFVDGFIDAYKDLWKKYEIDYSHFIRTTDDAHLQAVQYWLVELQRKGDIYKGAYEGWYCTPCETYLTEKDFEKGTKEPACPSCERSTKWVSEECFFFKLSAYQDRLLRFYKDNPDFITPKERAAEVVKFVEGGLQDLSISRTTISWGIPFPDSEHHVTYVWADALNNYITGIGYAQEGRKEEFEKWWPADMQVIGKDIVRFHAIYWPAFLMASGLKLPKQLLVHGWIKMGDHKMSKSRGNAVDPQELLKNYGADAVRYYLARQIAVTQDGQFSIKDLEQRIESDLANDLGNLLNRMATLAEKHDATSLKEQSSWTPGEEALRAAAHATIKDFTQEMERGFYHMALSHVWKLLNQTNAYFHSQEPWKLVKSDREAFIRTLSATCHSLETTAVLLWPVMPKKMETLFASIGHSIKPGTNYVERIKGSWNSSFTIKKGSTLFEKPEKIEEKETKKETVEEPKKNFAKIDDFVKLEFRVGTIIECEEVAKSEKLLKLKVDLGEESVRTIFSGIKEWYQPADLIGKQAVFIANLKPRKMMGEESQGMMLCCDDETGKPCLSTVQYPVPNGSLLT